MPSLASWSFNLISFLGLCRSGSIVNAADSICIGDVCDDGASLLQVLVQKHDKKEGKWNLSTRSKPNPEIVFVDLPMNFGEDIAKWAAFGADAPQIHFADEAELARNSTQRSYRGLEWGWSNDRREYYANLSKLMKPGRPLWGPLNPTLQTTGAFNPELPGLKCPLFYTPQKYWPKAVAEEYFGEAGTKEIFANLRNPFEMLTAIFRCGHDLHTSSHTTGTVRGYNASMLFEDGKIVVYSNDGKVCTNPDDGLFGDINTWVKHVVPNMASFEHPFLYPVPVGCYMQPQAPFFDGPYGITHPLDMREFPHTATEYLEKHGVDVQPGIRPNDLMHIRSCDNTWAGDFDDEAKALVLKYYKRDFEIACKYFGHCEFTEPVCNQHIPGMCPDKLFTWDEAAGKYHKKSV